MPRMKPANASAPCISFERVTFSYPSGPECLNDVTASFESGSFHLIQGRSGTGKSSLLRLICRLEEPTMGRLYFNRQPIPDYKPSQLRRKIVLIQQIPVLVKGSLRDNLLLPFSFRQNADMEKPDEGKLKKMLGELQLDALPLEKNATELSVGQAQRVCLIRGLLLSPEVVLLDEPTSALDRESLVLVEEMIERLHTDYGCMVVMVSHHSDSSRGTDHTVWRLENGRLEIRR